MTDITFDSLSFNFVVSYHDEEHYDYRAANELWSAMILPEKVTVGPGVHHYLLKRKLVSNGIYQRKFLFDGQSHIVIRINPISHPLFTQQELFLFDSSCIEASTIKKWLDLPNMDNSVRDPNGDEEGSYVNALPHAWKCITSNNEEIHIKTFGSCTIIDDSRVFACHLKFKKIKSTRGLFLHSISVSLPDNFCLSWLHRFKLLLNQKTNFGYGTSVSKDFFTRSRPDDECRQ